MRCGNPEDKAARFTQYARVTALAQTPPTVDRRPRKPSRETPAHENGCREARASTLRSDGMGTGVAKKAKSKGVKSVGAMKATTARTA